MRHWPAYALAILGYIGLALLTKRFLTWTWGPIYFLTVLEALPRSFDRIRHSGIWQRRRPGRGVASGAAVRP